VATTTIDIPTECRASLAATLAAVSKLATAAEALTADSFDPDDDHGPVLVLLAEGLRDLDAAVTGGRRPTLPDTSTAIEQGRALYYCHGDGGYTRIMVDLCPVDGARYGIRLISTGASSRPILFVRG